MRSLNMNIVNVVKAGGLDSSYVGIVLQQRGCSQVNTDADDVDEVIHNNYYRKCLQQKCYEYSDRRHLLSKGALARLTNSDGLTAEVSR